MQDLHSHPYPPAADFLHGKASHLVLRSLCSPTNQVCFPPLKRDRIRLSMLFCRIMCHMSGANGIAPAGGICTHRRQAIPHNPRAKGPLNLRPLGAKAPSIFRTFSLLLLGIQSEIGGQR